MTQNIYFSGNPPNLINEQALTKITTLLNPALETTTNHDNLYKFYDDYIRPNLFAIIVIVGVIIIIILKYFIKKYDDTHKLELYTMNQKNKNNNKNKQDEIIPDKQSEFELVIGDNNVDDNNNADEDIENFTLSEEE